MHSLSSVSKTQRVSPRFSLSKLFFQIEVMTRQRDKEEPFLGQDVTGVSARDKCKDDIAAVKVLPYMKI